MLASGKDGTKLLTHHERREASREDHSDANQHDHHLDFCKPLTGHTAAPLHLCLRGIEAFLPSAQRQQGGDDPDVAHKGHDDGNERPDGVQVVEGHVGGLRAEVVEETPCFRVLADVATHPDQRQAGDGQRHGPAPEQKAGVVGVRVANADVPLDGHGADDQHCGVAGEDHGEGEVVAHGHAANPPEVVEVDGDDHRRGGAGAYQIRHRQPRHQLVKQRPALLKTGRGQHDEGQQVANDARAKHDAGHHHRVVLHVHEAGRGRRECDIAPVGGQQVLGFTPHPHVEGDGKVLSEVVVVV
ncbi:hypothetical protein C0Q70_17036 [Pomacea canaliculata]|uniref:Uncharacterized protein n=1 Tax=Pomacea canaliculata TaxID=400727 RepID=A0A2T7NRI6_POMCA|nr:hypothetical protein C0Q70_17036 [Pomacea canaliculata]